MVEPSSSTNTPRRVSSLRRAGDDLVQLRLKRFFGRRGGFDERRRAVVNGCQEALFSGCEGAVLVFEL